MFRLSRRSREGALRDLPDFIICFFLLFCFLIASSTPSMAANALSQTPLGLSEPVPTTINLLNLDGLRVDRQLAADIQSQLLLWSGQQIHKSASPEEVTRQFYGWYLRAHFPNPKRSNMATFRKYVTQSFLKRAMAPDVDAVLFIDAQDTDQTWADNFIVSKATLNGQRATVQVNLNGKDMRYNLSVTLRREGGVWKINDVKGSDAQVSRAINNSR